MCVFREAWGARNLPPSGKTIIIEKMESRRLLSLVLLMLALPATSQAQAGIVDNVRIALMQNNFPAAEAQLNSYRMQRGVDAGYLEAYSWLGRRPMPRKRKHWRSSN